MNTNELQNEMDTRDEMCELTIEELDAVGGGGTHTLSPGIPINYN